MNLTDKTKKNARQDARNLMCSVCGCSSDRSHDKHRPRLDFGAGPAGVTVPGLSQDRLIRIERDVPRLLPTER